MDAFLEYCRLIYLQMFVHIAYNAYLYSIIRSYGKGKIKNRRFCHPY